MEKPKFDNLRLWQQWTGRAVLAGLLCGGLTWIGAWSVSAILKQQDAEFHRRVVKPAVERAKRGFGETASGRIPTAHFETTHELTHALKEWIERQSRRQFYADIQFYSIIALICTLLIGMTILALVNARARRLRASPERPADEGAGDLTKRIAAQKKRVTARAEKPGSSHWVFFTLVGLLVVGGAIPLAGYGPPELAKNWPWILGFITLIFMLFWSIDRRRGGDGQQVLEIEPGEGKITFRNFKFITNFAGNRRVPETVLGIRDILEVSPLSDQNGRAIKIRTTRGTVALFDRLDNFSLVEALLYDFVETNRRNPEAYREALSREPKIQYPWWAWLLLAVVCGATAGFIGWIIWITGPRPPG